MNEVERQIMLSASDSVRFVVANVGAIATGGYPMDLGAIAALDQPVLVDVATALLAMLHNLADRGHGEAIRQEVGFYGLLLAQIESLENDESP